MTLMLVVALVAVVIAHIVLLDRRDARERQERADLLQRIQAPQIAVAEHSPRAPTGTPLYLAPDDDKAWNEQHGRTAS